MYKLRTSTIKHENPKVVTLPVIFPPSSILFLWGVQSPQLLHYPLSGNNKWGFLVILFAKCPEKLASVLLENRTAPHRILWLQSLHVSNMGESARKVRSIRWFAGSAGETPYTNLHLSQEEVSHLWESLLCLPTPVSTTLALSLRRRNE